MPVGEDVEGGGVGVEDAMLREERSHAGVGDRDGMVLANRATEMAPNDDGILLIYPTASSFGLNKPKVVQLRRARDPVI